MKLHHVLSLDNLKRLPTPRVKAYLHSIHRAHDTATEGDTAGVVSVKTREPIYPRDEVTKDTAVWKALHKRVLAVLASREHVTRKCSRCSRRGRN